LTEPALMRLVLASATNRNRRQQWKAFVHKQDENGNDRLGTGINAGMVTPEYQNFANLERYFLRQLPPGNYHVEAFHNWDHRYGKPDLDTVFTVVPTNAGTTHRRTKSSR
jgi:hypothetical protein